MTVTYQGSQYWRHDWDPFVIQFSENWGIRWYGLAYVLGFLTASWLLGLYFKHGRSPMNPERRFNALVVLILATLAGGRLGYMLLYDFNALLLAPWKIFKVWEGGMASHGGIAGLALAVLYLARKNVYSKRKLADIVVTLGPPGIFLGRLANFINGELWGKISTVPWAVVFPGASPPGVPRHPSQLYEAVLEGLFLIIYLQLRFWKSSVTRLYPGQLCGEFCLLYALFRIVGELFREPDAGLILGMNRGIFYSLFMVLAGLSLIYSARIRSRSQPAA